MRALPLLLALATPVGPRFLADDPLAVDRDTLPVDKPLPVELSTTYDVLEYSWSHRPDGKTPPAANTNTLGEVPDSSWFTNRLGRQALSPEDAARGPATGTGPDASGPWTVVSGKSGGITPGFTMRDAAGEVWFVKFDPQEYLGLSTAADVIGARFFHALGYNVPENFVASFPRDRLRLAPEAHISGGGKPRRPMTRADLDAILARAGRLPDGSYRIVASRRVPGEPIGPFEYLGTRSDDPNDVFPHEHRRELRGLRLFCAWLNHDDSRSMNTLDTWLPEPRHVKHHLIDFSSTLGSGSDATRRIAPQNPRAGNEYILELRPALLSALTLGIADRDWRKVRFPAFPEVGNIEAAFFRPERWKPEYPNPAFERMRPADALWAARILAHVTDDMVRAVVRTGGFRDPAAEEYLVATLLKRRDKTVDHYLGAMPALFEFAAGEGRLRFRDMGRERGLGMVEGYEHEWFRFDNETHALAPLGPRATAGEPALPLPAESDGYLMARIRPRASLAPWRKKVEVYLRADPAWTVVGIEREE
ncbi:MAG TPA: hypothetical protein VII13_18875 [Vicinamibacteria bacterium]